MSADLATRIREAGRARFESLGYPNTRQEDWRHTSVNAITRTTFRAPEPGKDGDVAAQGLSALTFGRPFAGTRLVFVNGRFQRALSSEAGEGVEVSSLADALARQPQVLAAWLDTQTGEAGAFAALNAAHLEDGAYVRVADKVAPAHPIQLVFLSSNRAAPTVTHPRVLLVLGRQAQATVVESYGGRDGEVYWTNAVTEAVLGDGARLDHYKVQWESTSAFHTATFAVSQGRDTVFSSNSIALGGALSRNDIRQVFAGEGGECVLNGLFVTAGAQHADTHIWVDHAQPHCTSRQSYKGVLDGQSRGVFVGKVLVRAGAQKTDAMQSNKNLLLSKQALVDSLPQLEILANDVKCKHGSTTGQLDPAALFYLRSRGIGEDAAKSLLVYAFASDIVSRVKVPELRAGLTEYLQEHLPGALADIQEAVIA